jgi:tripartite-type tricarboxylate transporter receptor subunit TctC
MKVTRLRSPLAAALAILCVVLADDSARSQTARSIRIVVPTPPAGVNDIMARLLAEQIGRAQGVTLVVENRPGAGEAIGTEAVARAAPDGNTFLIAANLLLNPQLRKVSYDAFTSFEPICNLVSAPTVIVANSASPYRTLGDVVDAARARPGSITLGALGPGTPFHIGFEVLKRAAKADMTFVPYQGGIPALNALVGGHVTMMFGSYSNVSGQLKAGTVRALAVATRARIEPLPDVPTVAESGFKDFDYEVWFGSYAPARTPKESVSQLAGWLTTALQAPEVKDKLAVQGLYPVGRCGPEFAAHMRKQYDDYGRAIREANIKTE